MDKVSIVDCSCYEEELVYRSVKDAVEKIGFELPSDKRVLIKPNIMSQNRPEQHTITHFQVVDAICRLLREKGNEIIIGESIAFYQKGLAMKAFETSGIGEVARKYRAKLVGFEDIELVRFTRDDSDIVGLDEIFIPKILLDFDMVINACKLKSHSAMRFSGAIKNMFGCLPGGYKQKIHLWTHNEFELSDVFIDIHKIIKSELSIMDAIVGLDGGPTAMGKKVNTKMIIASENPAALDVVAATMIGYKTGELPILLQASKRGMIKSFEDIEIIGHKRDFHFKRLVKKDLDKPFDSDSIFVKHTYVDLEVDSRICSLCGKCKDSCPVKAVSKKNGGVHIDATRCINCYHCMSICPENAIEINPTPMNRLIWVIRKVTGL
ncbi:Uncharacterized conserved protein, DUF362 family [Dethiosulfatibacter aminovorans DSM 17477]|uniref:Uncharacterized conserved protein, DUF362 family n=1 Tax=Dethiosulfatibacter aminovorans DSM 17477 TaxID=1121476 RepID=A0A1M6JUU1_9FIRM|nr:DUF362 domain-containing protein [Dethiosulfatibacter aminovorans]SHJ50382.1 Uncharacterized conserved protein, DUF362 family [Dethiosulfatibacter aminovorans DSM 17477]